MSDQERRLALHQDITAQANTCNSVSYAGPAGHDRSGTAYWDVRCNGGPTYRLTVPALALAPTVVTGCGAEAPAPMAGPCFQDVGGDEVQLASSAGGMPSGRLRQVPPAQFSTANAMAGATVREPFCRATCASEPQNEVSACMSICLQGGDSNAAPVGADGGAAFGRFGAIYATEEPVGAWGFANGQADRLAVNHQAAAQCQTMAGTVPCVFQTELVNQCGAIARAQRRDPRMLVAGGGAPAVLVSAFATGTGTTESAARSVATTACQAQMATSSDPEQERPVCEILVSGC